MNKKTEIRCIRKNIMGTISFEMKADGMRKFQDFIVYPKQAGEDNPEIKIQSDNRIGRLNTISRIGLITNGKFSFNRVIFSENDLKSLKMAILNTQGAEVGSSVIKCDNSNVFAIL